MKKIAIIGSGYSGMLAAHAFLQKGHTVTVYSDRSAEDWLHRSRPTGTAARFGIALDYERELGLNHWETMAPACKGAHLTFSPTDNNTLVTLAGKLTNSVAQAVDLRLQSHRWMNDFEKEGGTLVIEKVSLGRLESIAEEHDFTLVAVGRGPLAELFERNEERSIYSAPQRKLAMVIVKDNKPMGFAGVPYLPIKINFLAKYGEAFWMPYYHKTLGATWSLLFEAKEGGKMDQFDACQTGEELVEKAKEVIQELMPHDYAWCENLELADEYGWLKGEITPTVRNPIGRLSNGKVVMALGDTAISMDPIAGQGANLGGKQVKHIVTAVSEHLGILDEKWMSQTFEAFWNNHGHPTVTFNNTLLEPLTKAGKLMMISQYGSTGDSAKENQLIANAIIENFRDPRSISDTFLDESQARSFIATVTKKSWMSVFIPSLLRAISGQLRQLVGLAPKHPLSTQSAMLDYSLTNR